MRIRAAVLREMGLPAPYAQSRPLEICDVELDEPGPGEMLVKIGAAGLCHSDLSVIDGSRPRVMPMVLGHEAAGTVVSVGPDVERFAAGDRIAVAFVPACGGCRPCQQGRAALCEPGAAANSAGTLLSGARRLHDASGDPLHHHLGVSAFADHAVVAPESAIPIPDDLPFELAALFGCAVLTGVGAVINAARITPDDSIAVFGLGGVGMSARAGRAAGRRPVDHRRRHRGREAGARRSASRAPSALPAGDDVVERVRSATGGGADYVIETVGNAEVLAQAYAATRRGGDHHHRRSPPPRPHAHHPGGQPRRRGADAAGLLPGLVGPGPRRPALHRSLSRRASCPSSSCSPTGWRSTRSTRALTACARGEAVRQVVVF